MNHLSHSQELQFKTCRQLYYYAHELNIRPVLPSKPLRMGTAYHEGLAELARSGDLSAAMAAAQESHNQYDIDDGGIELTTILCLLTGYSERWAGQPIVSVAVENEFTIPLRNPATGWPSRSTQIKGRFDGIVWADGGAGALNRLLVKESKLTSTGIAVGSPMRDCLDTDAQGSLYVLAAREAGYDVSGILWDLTAQPTIKPTDVPILDEDGLKIVEDAENQRVLTQQGKPRQTGDAAKGYTLLTRPMRADEWQEKLLAHIGANPEGYYARIEVPRTEGELDRYRAELWQLQKVIREARKREAWYRTSSRTVCARCEYRPLCLADFPSAGNTTLPDGFRFQESETE